MGGKVMLLSQGAAPVTDCSSTTSPTNASEKCALRKMGARNCPKLCREPIDANVYNLPHTGNNKPVSTEWGDKNRIERKLDHELPTSVNPYDVPMAQDYHKTHVKRNDNHSQMLSALAVELESEN